MIPAGLKERLERFIERPYAGDCFEAELARFALTAITSEEDAALSDLACDLCRATDDPRTCLSVLRDEPDTRPENGGSLEPCAVGRLARELGDGDG